jgi:hypothetical protein
MRSPVPSFDPTYCPYCGEPAVELIEVVDEDRSVGYSALEIMCPICAPRYDRGDA